MHTLLDNLLPAITWTFIHSLWQGLILTILAGAVLLLTRRSTAGRRYALLCGLFFLFLCSVLVTFFIEWNTGIKPIDQTYIGVSFPLLLSIKQWIEQAISFLNVNASWIVLIWFIIFLFKSGKMIREMSHIKSLRRSNTYEVNNTWMLKVQTLAGELRIKKPVLLFESALIKIPVVVGHFKPLILVPMGMLNNMSPAQAEAVLLHELAHIRRHDYLVNFIQRLAESVFFFNPALLWVCALLRAERENCCDEIAIARTGNKLQFVQALIHCKEYAMRTRSYAIGFFGTKKLLHHRLNRIVNNSNKMLSRFEVAFFILSLVVLTGLIAASCQRETALKPPERVDVNITRSEFPKETDRVQVVVDINSKEATKLPPLANKDRAQAEAERKEANRVEVNELLSSEQ